MQTSLSQSIEANPEKRKLDRQCKIVLSHKPLLARILKRTVEEVADMEINEIIAAIEGKPSIESIPVLEIPEKIEGSNTESVSKTEGTVYYDIRFYILVNEGKTKILFDVEPQNDYYPGYKIVTRGVVYCARMISSQINQEFDLEHYDALKKVYSIWICFGPPAYIGNAISRYHIQKEDLLPGIPDEKTAYDKLEIIMICLKEDADEKNDELIGMLNTLFSSEKSKDEIQQELSGKYGIVMERNFKKEVDKMYELSALVEKRGMERGMERGFRRGELVGQIKAYRKCKYSDEKIAQEMNISVREVKEIIKECELQH